MANFNFEESVINPILETIRDNQIFLTKKENIPQLAKLGYMYNTLWYAGRLCWGYDGILRDTTGLSKEDDSYYEDCSCEDNPKYKIEMCNPKTERIDNLIYDAWAMHVSNDGEDISFADFKKLILEGQSLTEFQLMEIKPQKTMTDWVEVLTHPEYKYRYSNKRDVYNHLLCVIGNGYGLGKDGFVIQEAGGADQDISLYGDWKNAKFSDKIQKVVDEILAIPEVEQTIEKHREYLLNARAKREKKKSTSDILFDKLEEIGADETLKLFEGQDEELIKQVKNFIKGYQEIFGDIKKKKEVYHSYYPISNYSIISQIIDKASLKRIGVKTIDPSIIEAGKEICREILEHEEEENKREGNVDFARKFLAIFGEGDASYIPKEINKKAILKKVKQSFSNFNSVFPNCLVNIDLNDREKSEYADDNIHIRIDLKNESDAPIGFYNTIEGLNGKMCIYYELNCALEKLSKVPGVKRFTFDYVNWSSSKHIYMLVVINPEYDNKWNNFDKIKSESDFIADGFMVGGNYMAKKLDKMNLIIITEKSETLGSKHPDNKSGKEYFSKAKFFTVCDDNWKTILDFHIDERGFNIISAKNNLSNTHPNYKIQNWILEEHAKMKKSNPAYGTYENSNNDRTKEGKEKLYAFKFINWLCENQI